MKICVCMLSCFIHVWLCNPMEYSLPDSSVHGILQARILEWAAMPSSRASSWPRDRTHISFIAGGFFTHQDTWKAPHMEVFTANTLKTIQTKGCSGQVSNCITKAIVQFSSVQELSCVWLFETPWTAACQASLSIANFQSSLRLLSVESVMPSNHLILCRPLLRPSIFTSLRVFLNESVFPIRWPKY